MNHKALIRTSSLLLIIAVTAVGLAQQQVARFEPSPERLRQHVTYLASDALEGRRTGTPGANEAANYIAAEFKRLGLLPPSRMRKNGAVSSFLAPFPYVAGLKLGSGNAMSTSGTAWQIGEDWMPLGISSNGRVEGPFVFVGYGITAAELNYNDYGGDISGKVAVALSGGRDGDNPHGQFARYEDVRWKAIAARTAGAKALVVIAREENFKDDRLFRLRYDNSSGDAGLPVIGISSQTAQRLLGSTLNDLEQAARTKDFSSIRKVAADTLVITTDVMRNEVAAANVIAILEGSDPTLRNEYIVLGAHYDHLGRGGEGSLAPREGEIHHGADDNASGTAGLLELARMFASYEHRPRRTIVFIAFGGEEEGLLGSNYYVNHPLRPLENTVAMINMDMIGRMKNNKLIVGGVGTAEGWRKVIDSSAKFWGIGVTPTPDSYGGVLPGTLTANPTRSAAAMTSNAGTTAALDSIRSLDLTLNEDGYGPSDHSSFYAKKVPVLFLWTGTHEDYHKPSDTADKINYQDEAHILSFVERIIRTIDASDARPVYTVAKSESQGRTMGFRVYLGTIPNYADSGDGLLLDGVRDDSPAAKAGIKAGDRIVKLAGREVHNVYDYTYALGEMKAGQEYEVELLRGTERIKLKITPAARK